MNGIAYQMAVRSEVALLGSGIGVYPQIWDRFLTILGTRSVVDLATCGAIRRLAASEI